MELREALCARHKYDWVLTPPGSPDCPGESPHTLPCAHGRLRAVARSAAMFDSAGLEAKKSRDDRSPSSIPLRGIDVHCASCHWCSKAIGSTVVFMIPVTCNKLPAQGSHQSDVVEQSNTLAGLQTQVQQRLVALQRQVAQAASKASEAKQKRHTLLADIRSCTRKTTLSYNLLTQQFNRQRDAHTTL